VSAEIGRGRVRSDRVAFTASELVASADEAIRPLLYDEAAREIEFGRLSRQDLHWQRFSDRSPELNYTARPGPGPPTRNSAGVVRLSCDSRQGSVGESLTLTPECQARTGALPPPAADPPPSFAARFSQARGRP